MRAKGWTALTRYALGQFRILAFRDRVMMSIEQTIEKIPGLSSLVEKISDSLSVFVLTLLEPYVSVAQVAAQPFRLTPVSSPGQAPHVQCHVWASRYQLGCCVGRRSNGSL